MFISNSVAYNDLLKWLKKPLPAVLDASCICIIQGPSGTGKTHGINTAIKECGLVINSISDEGNIKAAITQSLTSDVVLLFSGVAHHNKVIVFDDLDRFVSADRTFMSFLTNAITAGTFAAVRIIIVATFLDKKLLEKFYTIQLHYIAEADMILFMKEHFVSIGYARILEIAVSSKGNLGAAIKSADMYSICIRTDEIPHINTCCVVDTIAFLVENDPWIVPLKYHENILNRKARRGSRDEVYNMFMKAICEWDGFHKHKSTFERLPIEYISCVIAYTNKKFISSATDTDNFTRIFNNLSLRKKRKTANFSSIFPWNEVPGYWKDLVKEKSLGRKKSFLEVV